jgi:hypothetical protein
MAGWVGLPMTNQALVLDPRLLRVSSTLTKDVKNFGKAFMIDGKDETCWNSDTGIPQWICYGPISGSKGESVELESISLIFQGGFAGAHCELQTKHSEKDEWTSEMFFTPKDSSALQTFSIKNSNAKWIKCIFHTSSDPFGRIVVYQFTLNSVCLHSETGNQIYQ